MASSLSSYGVIADTVKFNDRGYSATETLGSFIVNSEYSKGFIEYINGINTADAYIWKCISAIGENLGEVVYSNIRNYIDFVSNVETCKIRSLRSMMKMLGFDYTVFDDIDRMPIEIVNLMNVMSISKNRLLDNETLQPALMADLSAAGAFLDSSSQLSDLSGCEDLSVGEYEDLSGYALRSLSVDDNAYFKYVTGLYRTVLSDFMYMEFNVLSSPEEYISDRDHFYVYRAVAQEDTQKKLLNESTYDDEVRMFKRQTGIPVEFDQVAELDKVERLEAMLSDYSYPQQELMAMEVGRREERSSKEELSAASGNTSSVSERSKMEKSRYAYYRKRKFREYMDFIDSKYFIDNMAYTSADIYKLDPNYMDIKVSRRTPDGDVIYSSVLSSVDGEPIINDYIIDSVARSLAVATMYIVRLREKLKLQTRKYYMKGTQNLLLYVINEYLIDYSRHKLMTSDILSGDTAVVADILSKLSSHSLEQIDVMEYYDETEYYNQENESTVSARYGQTAFPRFWEGTDLTADDGLSYKLAEIQKFYLSAMMMKDVLSGVDDLSAFLDTLFSTGADDAFVDKGTGMFSAKLSAYGGQYSSDIWPTLSAVQSVYEEYRGYAGLASYSYPQGQLSDQLSAAIWDYASNRLSDEYLSAVSVLYDQYSPSCTALSSRAGELLDEYNDMLSGDWQVYFISSDCVYSQTRPDETGRTRYAHDFYIDNPKYQKGVKALKDKFANFKNFVYSYGVDASQGRNIVNYPFRDTIAGISSDMKKISSDYERNVVDVIAAEIGDASFIDIQAATIDAELQYGYDYLNGRLDTRMEYLNGVLNELRQQAQQLQADYNSLESQFAAIVAQYDDNNTYFQLGATEVIAFSVTKDGSSGGWDRKAEPPKKSKSAPAYYVPELGMYYYGQGSGSYGSKTTSITPYNPADTLVNRIEQLISYMQAPTSYSGEANSYGLMKEGTYAAAQQCKIQYEEFGGRLTALVERVKTFGGTFKLADYAKLDLGGKIDQLVNYLTLFDEKAFEADKIVSTVKRLLTYVVRLSVDYQPVYIAYTDLLRDPVQAAYIASFTQSGSLTFAELDRMAEFSKKTDDAVFEEAKAKYEEMHAVLVQLEQDFMDVSTKAAYDGLVTPGFTGDVESDIDKFMDSLIADIDFNTAKGQLSVSYTVDKILDCAEFLSTQVSAYANGVKTFDQLVNDRIDELDFRNDPQYLQRKDMFLTYTGIQSESYYPYYPQSNQAHPSYQIHPFLWNFVLKDKRGFNQLAKVFNSIAVDELEDGRIQSQIAKYYGEFGQSISAWQRNPIDYSGYTTRYEASTHYSKHTYGRSEVIGYDGAFYPPALEMALGSFETCVSSLVSCVSISKFKSELRSMTHEKLSVDVTTEFVEDEFGNVIGVSCVECEGLALSVSDYVQRFFGNGDKAAESVRRYFAAKTTDDGILSGLDRIEFIDYVASTCDETFYGRFYRHLGIEKGSARHKFIVDQLVEYFPEISSMTAERKSPVDVYDIYKYGMDSGENIYFIYKEYGKESPTERARRDTPGRLWIRLAEHPFAFPAFTGGHPNVKSDRESSHPAIAELAGQASGDKRIDSAMSCFYDLQITQDGRNMYITSKIPGYPDDSFVQNNENSWIINFPLGRDDPKTGQFVFKALESEQESIDNVIRSGRGARFNSQLSAVPAISCESYSYIGQYLNSINEIRFVYAKKRHYADRTREFTGTVKIMPVKSGLVQKRDIEYTMIPSRPFASDEVVFAYDQGAILTFAYLVEKDMGAAVNAFTGSGTEISSNSSGAMYRDPIGGEMTSHDVMLQDVEFQKLKLVGMRDVALMSRTRHNLNADMSYIPVYPGLSGEASLCAVEDKYVKVELLGKSKDIDDAIAAVNLSVDPYFDFSKISSNYVFGRVYEDYDRNLDKSLIYFANPSINDNPVEGVDAQPSAFTWTISGAVPEDYTKKDANNVMLAVYNVNTLGKNPYFVGHLSELANGWIDVSAYQSSYVLSDFAEIMLSGLREMTEIRFVDATGTYDGAGKQNRIDSNHIQNIKAMRAKFDLSARQLAFRFELDDPVISAQTFVKAGDIAVILYNANDLRIFNHYHYMDVYGAVNLMDAAIVPTPQDIHGEHFDLIFNKSAYTRQYMIDKVMSYYEQQAGQKEYTAYIDLGKYQALSDVYILQTSRRLAFMYDEYGQDMVQLADFPNGNYYFPTLNTKYPLNMGAGFARYNEDSAARRFVLTKLFGQDNVFILDLLSADVVADKIGRTDIDIQVDDTECMRAYEQYTEFEDEAQVSAEYGKYDPMDSRSFAYLHAMEAGTPGVHIDMADQIAGILEANHSTEAACEELGAYPLSCFVKRSQEERGTASSDKVRFEVGHEVLDVKKLLKLYVNYKQASDGIHLYFNYFNFINTPYVEIRNNRLYPKILPETYLHLKPGQKGSVSFVVQFKYVDNGDIMGCKNVTLAKYGIYNVSDDKPKFMLKLLKLVKPGDGSDMSGAAELEVYMENAVVDMQRTSRFRLVVNTIAIGQVQPGYSIGVGYPMGMMTPDISDISRGARISEVSEGYLEFVVEDPTINSVRIGMDINRQAVAGKHDRYIVQVEMASPAISVNGLVAKTTCRNGSIEFINAD